MPRLSSDHISVTNVRPAYHTSLARGVRESDLQTLGLPRAVLDDDEGQVSGAATYAHMEFMAERGALGAFLVEATEAYSAVSLGVVGLSCKTVPTLGAALACHQRFQHLTNRTARYVPAADGERLILTEHRTGVARPGSLVMSDYTLLVAVRLLRLGSGGEVPVLEAHSRRTQIDRAQRDALEAFLDAPLRLGAERASLQLPTAVLGMPVATADPDLAAYFRAVLDRAAPFDRHSTDLASQVRAVVQDALTLGTPTGVEIGRRLGMSKRTLQRRLQEQGLRFSDLLADTRMQLAEGYLSDPTLSLAEVAYLLGYREESSFFRTFKRCKGVTPTQWRAATTRRGGRLKEG